MSTDKPKHTPGPYFPVWDNDAEISEIWSKRPRQVVAHVVEVRDVSLFLAAPELLAACKRFVAEHKANCERHLGHLGATRCLCDLCDVASAAIAKAEGRS